MKVKLRNWKDPSEEELEELEKIRKESTLILIGFGKNSLEEVLSWRGSIREEDAIMAAKKWPPVYRRESICEPGDVERYKEYVEWISKFNYKDHIAL